MNVTTSIKKQTAGGSVNSELRAPLAVLLALVSCEFLWPSLAAVHGDGLHLTFLWLLALACVFLWNHRLQTSDDPQRSAGVPAAQSATLLHSSASLANVGLTVFVVGVWLSTWNVFRVSGDRRAALNLAFAWTGIATCAFFCRMLAHHQATRRAIVNVIAGLCVGLAVFGIWQSHVFYPAAAEAYLDQVKVLETEAHPSDVMNVRRKLLNDGIPLDGPGRTLFEDRLLNSTEPFGLFALANTLAGVLAVGLVLLTGGLVSEWSDDNCRWNRLAIGLAASAVVAWCLILTKSRTAWVGAAVGIAMLLAAQRSNAQPSRSVVRTALMVFAALAVSGGVLFIAGTVFGAVDLQVLLESPRSLQFRFFYWSGAAGVISERPLFGAGPGNFRQLYLAHKSVQSSESIMDPHNFLVDAWCFAGVAGFIGMILLVAGVVTSLRPAAEKANKRAPQLSGSVTLGLLGCICIHFGWLWFSGVKFGPEHAMTVGIIVLAGASALAIGQVTWNPLAPTAGCLTLLVHLLGAGGLQITTLWFLFVALAAVALPPSRGDSAASFPFRNRLSSLLGAATCSAAAAITLVWGLNPVVSSDLQLNIGQQRFRKGDNRGALHAFTLATTADPLSPTMRQHFAVAKTYSLMRQDTQNSMAAGMKIADKEVQAAESACDQYIRSDTRRIDGRLLRARVYQQLHRLTGQSGYIESSLDDLRQVVAWDPTNARYQLELALCEETAGQTEKAVTSARKAKQIEAVNHAWGHSDQYLTTEALETMNRIIIGRNQ